MNIDFYPIASKLDEIKYQQYPSDEQIRIVINLISEEKFARYFFLDLNNPAWVIPLYKNNFFYNAPEPIEIQPGSFQVSEWPAGEYLAHYADRYEEIVADVVQSIQTENWRVQEILVDAMMKISPAKTAELVPVIDTWLNGRFSGVLPNKLIPLADHLLEKEFYNSAIQILEYVITPILPPVISENYKYRSPVRFRSDHYWVNAYCDKQLPKLLIVKSENVVIAFEHQLEKAIVLTKQMYPDDAEFQVGYYWRIDIPNRFSERSDADALDILIDGLRDSLIELSDKSVDKGGKFLETYLNSDHLIFQRIAMATLRRYGKNYPELVNQVLLQRNYLEDSKYANEYRGLLRDQFANVSEEVREKVINWILAGPMDLDVRAKRRATWENRDATDDDLHKEQEGWTVYHLEIIRGYLKGDALGQLNKLTEVYGKQDVAERPRIVTTSWGGPPSPINAEDLSKKPFEELKGIFLTYVPKDLSPNPRESLAQTLQRLVSEDPQHYSDFAGYLTDPAIRFVYVYYYLSGFRESVKNKKEKLTDKILDLCEYVATQKADPFEDSSGLYEPGLFVSQLEVARLLEEALHSEDSYLSRIQLDRIRSLLILLAHHRDPEKEDDEKSSFDPFNHSLNCVRGVIMHGIVHYSLYIIRQHDKLAGEKLKQGFIEPEIQKILEEKLDFSIEPSLAVHSVYGAYFPQLHFLSSEWLIAHLSNVFPESEEKSAFWNAAWESYIIASRVYRDVFKLLVPQYQRGLQLLSQPKDDQKHLGPSPDEHLAQHIMFAYLAGLTDFGHDNLLLNLFFSNAADLVRSQGVFWLSQVLENEKPSVDDVLWKKCWALWQKRLDTAETQEVSQNTQEISDYLRWLENCPVGLNLLYPILYKSIKYMHDGFDARQLIEYAAEYSDHLPLESVTLLQMTILWAKEPWWMPKDEHEEKILRAAMASGNEEARRIALEIINYRGERGDFRWKKLLE